ncbi:hypothetical protein C6T66_13445 [Burkholderia multivorans]|uniref:Uncharacterized protein n=1 Tax=Burkholderia multivorans TaxID=87883 RepID=A0A8E2RZE4_9BURK|nr:hypothetical protein C6P98_03745 [Burkholderia multivorans]PRG86780.1 hypothetical protein C6T66_13445 [Burkholderia multivorans]
MKRKDRAPGRRDDDWLFWHDAAVGRDRPFGRGASAVRAGAAPTARSRARRAAPCRRSAAGFAKRAPPTC